MTGMSALPIYLVGEDDLCAALAQALVAQSGKAARIEHCAVTDGFGPFRARVEAMNNVAQRVMPVLMVADADQAPCPVTQLKAWLPHNPSNRLALRLAVREAEAWAMADHEGFAEFARLSPAQLPPEPESLSNPKQVLLKLIARCKRRDLRDEMLPGKRDRSPVGLGYNIHLKDFVSHYWLAERAASRAPSLARAMPRIVALLDPSESAEH